MVCACCGSWSGICLTTNHNKHITSPALEHTRLTPVGTNPIHGVCSVCKPPDHLRVRLCADPQLHRPGSLVRHLPPSDVQEHGETCAQEHRADLAGVLHHHGTSGDRHGVHQFIPRAHQQDQSVHGVWRALGRCVGCGGGSVLCVERWDGCVVIPAEILERT